MLDLEYRKDNDLGFLEYIPGIKLLDLVKYLTVDASGYSYVNQELKADMRFKIAQDPHEYWDLIAAELQTFGGDTRANILRRIFKNGSGILYQEIVKDVLDELDCKNPKNADIHDLEKLIVKSCYLLMNHKPLDSAITSECMMQLANQVWAKWELFQGAKPWHMIRDRMPWGDNVVYGPKYCVTIPSVLYIAGLRKDYFEIAEKYDIPKKVSLGIIGMQQSGKTSFLQLLQKGDFSEELKRTFGTEEYSSFAAKILGINVEGGLDISGGDANVRHYQDYVKEKDRILFFFNAASYIKDSEYADSCHARFRYVYDYIYDENCPSKVIKFIATHIDEGRLSPEEREHAKGAIYDSVSRINAGFSKMFTDDKDALYVCNLKECRFSSNFNEYIKLIKFALGA